MKKHIKTFTFIIILILGAVACDDDPQETIANTDLIGCWVNLELENDSIWVFQRSDTLIADESGYQFYANDSVIERTSGWCGTPPISFYDVKSSYSMQDAYVHFYSSYDSDLTTQTWRIISINETELRITRKQYLIY